MAAEPVEEVQRNPPAPERGRQKAPGAFCRPLGLEVGHRGPLPTSFRWPGPERSRRVATICRAFGANGSARPSRDLDDNAIFLWDTTLAEVELTEGQPRLRSARSVNHRVGAPIPARQARRMWVEQADTDHHVRGSRDNRGAIRLVNTRPCATEDNSVVRCRTADAGPRGPGGGDPDQERQVMTAREHD